MSHNLAFFFSLIGSVLGYFTFQVIAAVVAFFLYGSGQTFSTKSGVVSELFVALQMAATGGLFYRKVLLKTRATFLIAVLTSLALFLYLEISW